jgi:hypothetical protein
MYTVQQQNARIDWISNPSSGSDSVAGFADQALVCGLVGW